MKKWFAVALVVALIYGYYSWKESLGWFGRFLPGSYQAAACAPVTPGVPPAVQGVRAAEAVGGVVRSAATTGGPSTAVVVEHVQGAVGMVSTWWRSFESAARGATRPVDAAAYEVAAGKAATAQQVAAASCTCPPGGGPSGGGAVPVGRTPGLTGAALARAAAAAAGFVGADLDIAVGVAGAESRFDPRAVSPTNSNGSTDYGMWQINTVHASILASGDRFDPYVNAVMARRVWSDAGGSWRPWTTFKSGSYRQYMPGTSSVVQVAFTAPAQAAAVPAASCKPTSPGASGNPAVPVSAPGPVGSCPPSGLPAERGMSVAGLNLMRCVHARWPSLTMGGVGSRPNPSDHPSGNAVDVMVSDAATGDAVSAWVAANQGALRVKYQIWSQRYWPAPSGPWEAMADRGSPTANHMDHVHVSVLS